MEFLHVDSAQSARTKLFEPDRFPALTADSFTVSLKDALGLSLYSDIYSNEEIPPYDRSTVDGYAIRAVDCFGASESIPAFLDLAGSVNMGEITQIKLMPQQAVYVPTGAMVPDGTDCVVMIEHTEKLDEQTIAVNKPVAPGEGLVYRGDDVKSGQLLLNRGTKLDFRHLGLLAAVGVSQVQVYRPIRCFVISTGDEIVAIDAPYQPGKLRDVNGYTLGGLIETCGAVVTGHKIVQDDYELLKQTMKDGLSEADVLFISGGSSVGERDYTLKLINELAEELGGSGSFVHGIGIKPGKPTIFGEVSGKPVFGLPGHPMSAVMVFLAFVDGFLRQLTGQPTKRNSVKACLTSHIHSSPGSDTYQLMSLTESSEGLLATPLFGKSSLTAIFTKADGFMVIGADDEGHEKGEMVDIYLW